MLALITALTLAVPYLPQTEALCGGAAAAMVFRFLGDRHADVQQFQSLVDADAGGIADTVLVDAIRARGWQATRLEGSVETIRTEIAAGRAVMLLIVDRPSRYHYVVAVGADEERVFVHDPTWGPARPIGVPELVRRWQPTGFWTLRITAGNAVTKSAAPARDHEPRRSEIVATTCDRMLDEALDEIDTRGSSAAEGALESVSRQCPTASGPFRELAGIRFSQQRWREAAQLATQAVERDAGDEYAWDVLGSSRFILNDEAAALEAWNHIDKPRLDSVQISGLTRTRYALLSQFAALTPNTVLTAGRLLIAERRLRALPDQLTTSVAYRPDDDGFATVNVAIVERPQWPHSPVDWTAIGVQAAVNREVAFAVPGNTGQGELWEASWRWWSQRPRVAVSFSAPRAGRLAGIWRLDGSWEAQTYRQSTGPSSEIRQEQTHGALSFSNWVAPNLRIEAFSGLDAWSGSGRRLRAGFFGAGVDRRWLGDRVALSGIGTRWAGAESSGFQSASIRAAGRSSGEPAPLVLLVDVRADFASAAAPLALWPGAGDGRARAGLLRAHPLLEDGVIAGPAFGRRVQSGTLELQRWFGRPRIPRVGMAIFADAANAQARLEGTAGRTFHVDAGVGLRLRVPGSERTLRVDYAHGLRDRQANALTFGIIVPVN